MKDSLKFGTPVIFNDEKYSFEGINPDGSYLLKRWGSTNGVISAPASKVRLFLIEGRVPNSGMRLNG